MEMYRSGVSLLPASAMPKPKQPLGFVGLRLQLFLPPGPVYQAYLGGDASLVPYHDMWRKIHAPPPPLVTATTEVMHRVLVVLCKEIFSISIVH